MSAERPGFGRPSEWSDGPRHAGDAGDGAVDAALASLAAVGDREKRLLQPEVIDRIARAAAHERSGSNADADAPPLIEVEPLQAVGRLGVTGMRSRPWSSVAMVAAVLAAVVAGAAILSSAPQQVVTQDSASVGPDPSAPGAVGAEPRPVLDLGDATTTTAATPATTVVESSVTEAPTTQPPPTTAAQTSTLPPSTVRRPPDAGWMTLDVGIAGTVDVRLVDNRAEIGTVATSDGWTSTATVPRSGGSGVEFTDGVSVASLEVWSEPGSFRLAVDHGGFRPSPMERTYTYTIADAGTVVIIYGSHGLTAVEIDLGGAWQHRVSSLASDHLEITIVAPMPGIGHNDRLAAGPVLVDLRITGS